MNIFQLRYMWKALTGQSLTFALLLAFGILGLSILAHLRAYLAAWGVYWPFVWLLSFLVVAISAKYEQKVFEERKSFRRRLSLGLVLLSLLLSYGLDRYGKWLDENYTPASQYEPPAPVEPEATPSSGARPTGPRNR